MATLSSNNPTLLDLATRQDPNGQIAAVVELLNQENEILQDITFREGNLTTGHKTTVRTGIPNPTWRKMYGFVQPTKTTTAQVVDTTGMLENYGEVDKALADLEGNTAAFRLSEERGVIEGFMQEVAQTLFYGNDVVAPEEFMGMSPRYNSLSATSGENIINGGGAGADNASIWLIVWSPETIFGIVPKGSQAGLQIKDLGEVTKESASGLMQVYRTHYRWDVGLVVRDWRFAVRAANIDKSLLTVNISTGADLADLMFQMLERVPNLNRGRPVFYMSRSIRTMLRRQMANKLGGSTLRIEQVGGVPVTMFQEVPIRRCDVLAGDEALVA